MERKYLTSLLFAPVLSACVSTPAATVSAPQAAEPAAQTTELTPETAREAAKEAFFFGFPLVMNYKTLNEYTLNEDSGMYKGPFNQNQCEARLYTPKDTTIITPNSDTPYCMGWFDLSAGPLVYSVPAMESDRFYHVQFTDWYTHNYDYIGTRTDKNKAGKYLMVGPSWQGEKPEGFERVIQSETNLVFTIIRTQLKGAGDLARVKEIQSQYTVTPLAGESRPDQAIKWNKPPAWKAGAEFTPEMFNYMDFALDFLTPHPEDKSSWENLALLGLGTPETFDINAIDPAIATAMGAGLAEGLAEAQAFIKANSHEPLLSADVFGTRKVLEKGTAVGGASREFKRTTAALAGIYGNSGEEAVYPTFYLDSTGAPLDAGKNNYTLTFEAGSLPPAKAFWSLSMYDGKTQLFIENSLNRYLLNSSGVDTFKKNEDGSITLLIQKDAPAKDRTANWLPAPDGPFYMVLRLYLPTAEMLDGKWTPPKPVPAP